ncbi:MAG TPA: hypothetical protein VMD59_20810, partial [Acidimicrobiales bacterium]|nr:hypothetical protein [Acidimicrobiales bacterium]
MASTTGVFGGPVVVLVEVVLVEVVLVPAVPAEVLVVPLVPVEAGLVGADAEPALAPAGTVLVVLAGAAAGPSNTTPRAAAPSAVAHARAGRVCLSASGCASVPAKADDHGVQ